MARPLNVQQMAANWQEGIAGVTQADFCARQTALGVRPDVCATRYQMWQQRVQGKADKFISRWQNA
jgi:hypothetical protein